MLHVYKSSSKSSTALVHVFLTPQKTQKNHSGQQFWPNYLHAIAFRKRCASNVWFRGLDMQSVPSPAWPNSEEANAAGYVRSCYRPVVSSNGTGSNPVSCTGLRNERPVHAAQETFPHRVGRKPTTAVQRSPHRGSGLQSELALACASCDGNHSGPGSKLCIAVAVEAPSGPRLLS